MVHLPTLAIVTALVIACAGAILVLLFRIHRRFDALAIWGASMLLGAVGLWLVECVALPAPWHTLAGTTLLLLASALSWTAARVFAEQEPLPPLLVAGPGAWLFATVWLPLPAEAPGALACLMGALYTVLAALALRRCRAERLPSLYAALALLYVHAAVFAGRAVLTVLAPPLPTEWVAAAVLIEALLHTTCMAMVLLVLSTERSERLVTAKLRRLALQDGLTGLSNRRHFDQELAAEFGRAVRAGQPLALLILDADHFKRFNDRYGHLQGDACLCSLATAVAAQVRRPGDLVARFGGEEFVVLLPDTEEDGAQRIAETIRHAVEALGIPHGAGVDGRMTVSVGVAAWTPSCSAAGAEPLLRAADQALYAAKAAGRNRVRIAGPLPRPAAPHAAPERVTAPG